MVMEQKKLLGFVDQQVGDAGPILDVMSMMLESISTPSLIARTTISAVYRTAQIAASVPNLSYQNKVSKNTWAMYYLFSWSCFVFLAYTTTCFSCLFQAFPETLFHQILPAMVHPDHEIRLGAHRIFSVVLVPTSVAPHLSASHSDTKKGSSLTLSRTVSVFSSSAALFEKLQMDKNNSQEDKEKVLEDEGAKNGMLNRLKSSYSRVYSMKTPVAPLVSDEKSERDSNKEAVSDGKILQIFLFIFVT